MLQEDCTIMVDIEGSSRSGIVGFAGRDNRDGAAWPWRPILPHRVTAREMRLPLVLVSSSANAVSTSSLSGLFHRRSSTQNELILLNSIDTSFERDTQTIVAIGFHFRRI